MLSKPWLEVFGAVQAVQADIARIRRADGSLVERTFHPGHEAVDGLLVGLRFTRRRHQSAAELADRLFPDIGFRTQVVLGQGVVGETTGPVGAVVALATSVFDEMPGRRIGGKYCSGRHQASDEQQGTRGEPAMGHVGNPRTLRNWSSSNHSTGR